MRDLAHEWTDREIEELERRVRAAYKEARDDIEEKMSRFLAKFLKDDEKYREQLKNGKIIHADYRDWLAGQVFQKKRWEQLLNDLTDSLARANELAMAIINETVPEIFAYNANWTAYTVEKELDARGYSIEVVRRPGGKELPEQPPKGERLGTIKMGFELYTTRTVKMLLRDEPTLLPPSRVDIPKDKRWNMKNITAQITQGILQGESLSEVAQRLRRVEDMNVNSSLRHARTAMTGAQNAARLEELYRQREELRGIGLDLQKRWRASRDMRVRKLHRELDGQIRDLEEPFEVDGKQLQYPGDPDGPPEMVYECRCRMETYYPDFPDSNAKMRDDSEDRKPIKDMSYKEWLAWKQQQAGAEEKPEEGTAEKKNYARAGKRGIIKARKFRTTKELKEMPIGQMREETAKLAAEWYRSGRSGISFPDDVDYDAVAKLMADASSRTTLTKDYKSLKACLTQLDAELAGNTVVNAGGKLVTKVKRSETYGIPNSIAQVEGPKGGIDRNYYDEDGKQSLQICNNDHGNPKAHAYGEHGEHAHDYTWSEEDVRKRSTRALTDEERKENGDIL